MEPHRKGGALLPHPQERLRQKPRPRQKLLLARPLWPLQLLIPLLLKLMAQPLKELLS
jgi:hypothetical protein